MHSASAPQRKAPAFFAETLRDGLLLTSLPGAGGEGGCTDLLCFLKYYITPDAGCQCFFDVFARNFFAQGVHIRHARGHTKRSTNGTERRCAPWRTAKTRTRTAIRIRTSSRRRTSRISRTNRTSRIRTRSNTYLKGWPQHPLRPTFIT